MGPEGVPRSLLHSEEIPSEANNWAGQNYVGYENPEMDALLDAIEIELDRGKRKVLWAKYQRLFAEELPILPLYFRTTPFVVPKWLHGVVPTGHKFSTTYWVENWRAE
jgi:peptide/nickel transport system substrate-binding protein